MISMTSESNFTFRTSVQRWLFLTLTVLLLINALTVSTSAATYFVDYENGNDSHDGLNSETPWKHCPGDPNATDSAAQAVLAGGDIVQFKNNSVYVGSISLKWNGDPAKRIVYDGSTWGTGARATITTRNNTLRSTYAFSSTDSRNLTIIGFKIMDCGGYAETDPIWSATTPISQPPSGTGITLIRGGDITVTNCVFREIGQWQNQPPMSGTTSVTGTGVALEDNQNVVVVDCDFTRMKTGVSIKARTAIENITVLRSSFHNYMNWLIDVAPYSPGASLKDITIDGCRLYNYKEFDEPNWEGYSEKPHQDGIFLRTSAISSTWTNIVIRNTVFYSDDTSDGGTASIYVSQGPSVDIYNCAFLDDKHANGAVVVGWPSSNRVQQRVRIWNCTFVGSSTSVIFSDDLSSGGHFEVKNCIFYRTVPYQVADYKIYKGAAFSSFSSDYNVYFGPNSARAVYDGNTYRTLEQWRSISKLDSNSIWADPRLLNLSGSPSSWNVQPLDSSPARGVGADLSSYFSTDIVGALRTSIWDIGAHQATGVTKLPPPLNLQIK